MYEDNSMEGARRKKEREAQRVMKERKRREESMEELNKEFDEEVYRIRKIQNNLRTRQSIMARLAVELYSCVLIQSHWRIYLAKTMLHRLRSKRFFTDWFRYCTRYRWPRRKAAARIVKFYRYRKAHHLMTVVEKLHKEADKIKKWFRKRRCAISFKEHMELLISRRRVVKRALVFGMTRAAHKIRIMRIEAQERSPRRLRAAKTLIRFFRSIVLTRRWQFLLCHTYCQNLKTFDSIRYMKGKKNEERTVHGQTPTTERRQSTRRSTMRRDDGPEVKPTEKEDEEDGLVPRRATYLAHAEVILFILSCLVPDSADEQDDKMGGNVDKSDTFSQKEVLLVSI